LHGDRSNEGIEAVLVGKELSEVLGKLRVCGEEGIAVGGAAGFGGLKVLAEDLVESGGERFAGTLNPLTLPLSPPRGEGRVRGAVRLARTGAEHD